MDERLFDIANYIIARCPDITNMKLQKLVYYSHAQFLVSNNGESLINSDIEAWIYGPVIRPLYEEFSKFSFRTIKQSMIGDGNRLENNHREAIDRVLELYRNISAGDLSDKTHAEDPWQDAYQSSDWSENIITNDSILEYYRNNPLS